MQEKLKPTRREEIQKGERESERQTQRQAGRICACINGNVRKPVFISLGTHTHVCAYACMSDLNDNCIQTYQLSVTELDLMSRW